MKKSIEIEKRKIYLLTFTVNLAIVLLLDAKWAVDVYVYDKNQYSIFNKLLSMASDTMISNIYYWLFPYLAASPSILNEKTNISYSALRLKMIISSFISGFRLISFPLIIDFGLQSLTVPSTYPMPDDMTTIYHSPMFCSELYFSNPRMFVLLWIFIMSVYGGLFACLGFNISELTKNKILSYLVLTAIWVGNYILSLVLNVMPWKIMLCAGNGYGYNSLKLIVSNLFTLISIVALVAVIGSREDRHDKKNNDSLVY